MEGAWEACLQHNIGLHTFATLDAFAAQLFWLNAFRGCLSCH